MTLRKEWIYGIGVNIFFCCECLFPSLLSVLKTVRPVCARMTFLFSHSVPLGTDLHPRHSIAEKLLTWMNEERLSISVLDKKRGVLFLRPLLC